MNKESTFLKSGFSLALEEHNYSAQYSARSAGSLNLGGRHVL